MISVHIRFEKLISQSYFLEIFVFEYRIEKNKINIVCRKNMWRNNVKATDDQPGLFQYIPDKKKNLAMKVNLSLNPRNALGLAPRNISNLIFIVTYYNGLSKALNKTVHVKRDLNKHQLIKPVQCF